LAGFAARERRVGDRATAGFILAVVWLCWPLLYHQFGSQSATHFVPMHRLSRHLVVYAPGAMFAIVAGCFFIRERTSLGRNPTARKVLVLLGAFILLTHLYFNWRGEQIAFDAYQDIKGTYARIRSRLPPGVRTIVGDPGDLCFFDFWLNPLGTERVRVAAFANYSRCEELQGSVGTVVLTHSNQGWQGLAAPVIRETVERLPCLLNPPASWRLLYGGYPEKVYVIDDPGDARQ
jgi:hypothetical protein